MEVAKINSENSMDYCVATVGLCLSSSIQSHVP